MGFFGKIQFFMLAAVLWRTGVLGQAPSQAGFISIDCGATKSYVEVGTGISWVPDTNYTSVGVNSDKVQGASSYAASISTVRYFPNPQKHCYELPGTVPNASYLVRSTYWYGNYDRLDAPPSFEMALDSSPGLSINVSGYTMPYVFELIYKARKTSITVCLYRDGTNTTPFISALELRPFQPGAYEHNILKSGGALGLLFRLNMGGPLGKNTRYPDDVYDRIWLSWTLDGLTVDTLSPVSSNLLPLMPPSAVMQSASTGTVLGPHVYLGSLFSVISRFPNPDILLNLFFAEIGTTPSATSRAFNISLNADYPMITENPYLDAGGPLKADVESLVGWGGTPSVGITLIPLPTATEPPLLNAVECFVPYKLSTLTTAATDVLAILQIKDALGLTLSSAGDPCLPVPIGWITCSSGSPPRVTEIKLSNYSVSGGIPAAFASLSSLTLLWLDNNALTGPIPDLSKLTRLTSLHLENNDLNGTVPATLGALPLTELFLQNNNFVGMVPNSLFRDGLKLDLSGNPGITDQRVYTGPSAAPTGPKLNTGGSTSKSNTTLIAGIVGGVVGAFVLIVCVVLIIWRQRKKNRSEPNSINSKRSMGGSSQGQSHKPIESGLVPGAQRYSYAEIVAASNNFKDQIGSGGFGPVHYGRLPNGQEVAIKTLDADSHQGSREFTNEVELLSRIHHKNLVKLLGFCEEGQHQVLVYEFLHKGTVQEHLYGSKAAREPLDLKARLDIALNAAQGVEYLHNGCNPSIIHRDIKSNNILLTGKYVAKVADFGLSKLGGAIDATHVVTDVKGTPGYLDPEYYVSNALTTKSDVFSFGVVLLEILGARAPIVPNHPIPAHTNICHWARALLQTGSIEQMLDGAIARERPNMDVIWKVAELAILCVEPKGKHRPTMQDVVKELREAVVLNGASSGSFSGKSTYGHGGGGAGSGYASSNSSKYSLPTDSNNSMVQPRVR